MKVTINTDDFTLIESGAMLAKRFHDAGHSACGYLLEGGYSGHVRKTKAGHIVVHIYPPHRSKRNDR